MVRTFFTSDTQEKRNKTICYCVICNKYIGDYTPSVLRKVCSINCRKKLNSIQNKGCGNPNYRHGKNIENKCKLCKKEIDPRSTTCQKCRSKFFGVNFKGKRHTEETKKLIGKKSSEKFTPEFKLKMRKILEERGYWIPEAQIPKYLKYYRACEWDEGVPNTGDFNRVRDHEYSRIDGFTNNVPP